jgi:hypothetical protein
MNIICLKHLNVCKFECLFFVSTITLFRLSSLCPDEFELGGFNSTRSL